MSRQPAFMIASAASVMHLGTIGLAAENRTAGEAKAMLKKAILIVKKDEAKALDMFHKGECGFRDRDSDVFCANASDGAIHGEVLLSQRPERAVPRQQLPFDGRQSRDVEFS